MKTRITELGCKEVINVCDGTRYGYVNDVEIDCTCGKILALVVHCGGKILPMFSKNDDIVIPWDAIRRIGDDIILVDYVIEPVHTNKKSGFFLK